MLCWFERLGGFCSIKWVDIIPTYMFSDAVWIIKVWKNLPL